MEDEVMMSPLSRELDLEGKHMKITIYRGTNSDDDWMLEVIDSDGCPTVSNEMFQTDQAAFNAALRSLRGQK